MQVLLVIFLECLNIIFVFWWNPAGDRGEKNQWVSVEEVLGTLPKWLYFSQGLKTRQLCLEQPLVLHWHPSPPSPSFKVLNLDETGGRRASHVCLGQKVRRDTWEPSAICGGGRVALADIHIWFQSGGTAFQWPRNGCVFNTPVFHQKIVHFHTIMVSGEPPRTLRLYKYKLWLFIFLLLRNPSLQSESIKKWKY